MSNEPWYQIYSEFRDSDWYIYWDKEYSRAKKYQLLVVWHIKAETYVYYDYVTLKPLIAAGTAHTGLSYAPNLSSGAINEFTSICKEFLADIDVEFGKDD